MVAERSTSFKRKVPHHGDERKSGSDVSKKRRKQSATEDEGIYTNDSVFCQLMSKAELTLKDGKTPNILGVDQAVFQRNLHLALKRHEDYPNVIEQFIEGFQDYIEVQNRLHFSLVTTATSSECDSARSSCQDCFVRLLLGIDILQPRMMECLLEKLAEFTGDEDSIFEHGERVNLPRLLMSQFRWLDRIVNGKEVTKKMLEMIEIVSLDIQREIITCLPEVVEDSEHGEVASALRDLLMQNKQLTVPILDALSNLTLKAELMSEVRGSVLQTLASVEMEDLPVVIRFLLQSVSSADAVEVVSDIRANLDFDSGFLPLNSSTPHDKNISRKRAPNKSGDAARGAEALTMDAIKSGIRFQKSVAEAWIKAIDAVKMPADHKVMDIFVLMILHTTNRKKTIESLFRNKIRSGAITEVLLQDAFGAHAEVMRDYFPSILSLAEVLLRSPEQAITYFACALYKCTFVTFDSFCQQEIVGNLVTHIGSGFEGEVDSSLDILAELVEKHLRKMAPFAIFVKGVLDYLDNLSVTQIRKLYSILSMLAFTNPHDTGLIQDDLHIVIRKQLSNDNPKYKRMGIIGAVMIVKSIAYNNNGDADSSVIMSQELTENLYKQVTNLLQLVRTSYSKMPDGAALFMDELSSVVRKGHLDRKVEEWITENVTTDFQDDYVVDISESQPDGLIPSEMVCGLDDDAEGSIAIPLVLLVEKSLKDRKKKVKENTDSNVPNPICLSPTLRLLSICEERQAGNLDNIDALLGCPVFMMKEEVYEKMDPLSTQEKDVICETLFHSLNWFRELVNAFATETNPEMKGKVISRLQNITDLQGILEKCLAAHPGYVPPAAIFEGYDAPAPVTPVIGAGQGEGKKKGKKPAKKKKAGQENGRDDDSDESSKDSSVLEKESLSETLAPEKQEVQDKPAVSLANYRPFFRELDISVFTILHTGLITKADLDTEMNTKATTELRIQAPQLQFLLEDLTRKLSHLLVASTSKRRSFLKTKADKNVGFSHLDQHTPKNIAEKAVKLLPAICDHLEHTSGYFQTMIAANDGLLDGPGSHSPESLLMASCFHYLLQTLQCVFSWNGFLMTENKPLLKEGLHKLMSRIKSTGTSQMALQDIIRSAHHYVENFENTIPDISTGVILIRLLLTLAEKSDSEDLKTKTAAVAESFLKREWLGSDGQKEKGAKYNENLQFLLKIYLSHSEDLLTVAEAITTKGIPELLETDKNGYSNTFPTLTKSTFPVYFRVVFAEIIESIKTLNPGKQNDDKDVKLDKLLRWSQAVRILHILVNLIKAFDARGNLNCALKFGRQFVDIFLRLGMPLLDHVFRANREDVLSLLKNLQLSTRNLHHMCGHSKIMKDLALTNQVPFMKKSLEAFVYRVKAMLTFNKCLEAFWLGNLKNRDLQGEEILSQASIVSQDTTEAEDKDDAEDVPDDEEESDVELDNQSDSDDNSNSEGDSRSIGY